MGLLKAIAITVSCDLWGERFIMLLFFDSDTLLGAYIGDLRS